MKTAPRALWGVMAIVAAGCGGGKGMQKDRTAEGGVTAPAADAATVADAAAAADAASAPDTGASDRAGDGAGTDAAGTAADAAPATVHSCGGFSVPSGWTTAGGFRSAVVAMGAPLSQPVALLFAGGGFGDSEAFVVDQGTSRLLKLNAKTGALSTLVAETAWAVPPKLLTTIVWDRSRAFDGNLYVGDQGGDGDADSVIYRVDPTGANKVFAMAPGAGLDDIYGMAFSPGGTYPPGLYVSGDTDGGGDGFGRLDASGMVTSFAKFSGVEGLAVDGLGRFGGGLYASMPNGGGYAGDDTVSKINPDGGKATPPLASGQPGIHALVFAPDGPFGGDAYAASWQTGKVLRIAPGGTVTEIATGLSLTNYDGNVLAFSPDGRILFVADRMQARIVCIEPAAEAYRPPGR
jgi:hypothetical protein